MRTLQEQYNLIKEGNGNKSFFLKSALNEFPNLVNQFTTYDNAVSIFKSKGILSEGIGGLVTKGKEQDWHQIFKSNIKEEQEVKVTEKKTSKEIDDLKTKGFDFKDLKNIDNIYGEQFLKGFYTEMQDPKNEDKSVNDLKKIVAKNLAKNRLFYVEDGQFGTKGLGYKTELPGLGTPKEAKGKYKSSGYGSIKEGSISLVKLMENIQDINEIWKWKPSSKFRSGALQKYIKKYGEEGALKHFQKLYDLGDLNNPNENQREEAEWVLQIVGFFDDEGAVGYTEDYNEPILKKLSDWAEENRT